MKPKPLNLEEWLKKVNWSWDKDCLGEEKQIFVSETAFDDLKQRIKSACEFYLKYKDDPELLWKEQLDNIEKLKAKIRLQQFLTNIREIPSPKGEVSCVHGWDMYDKCKLLKEYNKWLFKLAFKDVFEK